MMDLRNLPVIKARVEKTTTHALTADQLPPLTMFIGGTTGARILYCTGDGSLASKYDLIVLQDLDADTPRMAKSAHNTSNVHVHRILGKWVGIELEDGGAQ